MIGQGCFCSGDSGGGCDDVGSGAGGCDDVAAVCTCTGVHHP